MRIYPSKEKKNKVLLELKKILIHSSLTDRGNFIEVKNFRYGYIYDKLPKIENIEGVRRIEIQNKELLPKSYSTNCYFKRPINTNRKFIIAGPCVIDDFNVFYRTALKLKEIGVDAIRTPLFKPRSLPYGYEGMGVRGIEKLKGYKNEINLPFVGEVLDPRDVEKVLDVFEVIQIGARNMKNYPLLKEVAKTKKPVLLKRQPKSTLKEFLFSLEYLLKYGAKKVILCERGDDISNSKPSININIIKDIKKEIRVPIIADISHSAKSRKMVMRFFRKSIKYADGIMVEVSVRPELSPIDTKQIIDIDEFLKIKRSVEKYNEEI
jgi:3-deoxy-7-phosphoheptulonate synthase